MQRLFSASLSVALLLAVGSVAWGQAGPYRDVPADHWAVKSLQDLAAKGILAGYPDGSFRGEKSVNRYEMAQVLYNAIRHLEETFPKQAGGPPTGSSAPAGGGAEGGGAREGGKCARLGWGVGKRRKESGRAAGRDYGLLGEDARDTGGRAKGG